MGVLESIGWLFVKLFWWWTAALYAFLAWLFIDCWRKHRKHLLGIALLLSLSGCMSLHTNHKHQQVHVFEPGVLFVEPETCAVSGVVPFDVWKNISNNQTAQHDLIWIQYFSDHYIKAARP
jgi:hypothetical protein